MSEINNPQKHFAVGKMAMLYLNSVTLKSALKLQRLLNHFVISVILGDS